MLDAVSKRLATAGTQVLGFPDIDALTAAGAPASEAILVLDTETLPEGRDIPWLMGRVRQLHGSRPSLVCIAHSGAIEIRLQALRAGADAFFLSPVAVDELAAQLLELSGAPGADDCRVLVVDDQPVVADFSARILENAGMQTRVVVDPGRVLAILETFRPDLVLMDLHMPGVDGIELTALIREHEALYDIPVIFLSSELDTGKQMETLRVGGNDFIPKPARPEQLVQTVRRNIHRFRRHHGRQPAGHDRDPGTGLLSRSAFLRRLDASIKGCHQQGPGCGLLLLTIDLTDPDEPAVDHLMQRLAEPLREPLQAIEYAARYDHLRFALLIRRLDEDQLLALAEALCRDLPAVDPQSPIRVRIGIGRFDPPVADSRTLIARAEQACPPAGEPKGGRVGLHRPPVADDPDSEEARRIALLTEALRSEGLHLVHQPIMALRGGNDELYETTLRLAMPDGAYLPAPDLLPAARRGGLLPAIDRWVMEHALDRLEQEQVIHQRLRFLLPQTMETLSDEAWLPWLRDRIIARDLIKTPPILQFQLDDLVANRGLAGIRFKALQRLAIKTCLPMPDQDPRVLDLIRDLGIALVRLPLPTTTPLDPARLTDLVTRIHAAGAKVIITRIQDPQTIARIFGCGVDLIQGNFLQAPSAELSFDFGEVVLT